MSTTLNNHGSDDQIEHDRTKNGEDTCKFGATRNSPISIGQTPSKTPGFASAWRRLEDRWDLSLEDWNYCNLVKSMS